MAEGLDSDEEDEAEASPARSHPSEAYSNSSDANEHRPRSQLQPSPHFVARPDSRQQDAASRDLERDIAQALAADAAFLEDPSMSLREGALQPLEAAQEEGGYELPALSAGGTISKVSRPLGTIRLLASLCVLSHGSLCSVVTPKWTASRLCKEGFATDTHCEMLAGCMILKPMHTYNCLCFFSLHVRPRGC